MRILASMQKLNCENNQSEPKVKVLENDFQKRMTTFKTKQIANTQQLCLLRPHNIMWEADLKMDASRRKLQTWKHVVSFNLLYDEKRYIFHFLLSEFNME